MKKAVVIGGSSGIGLAIVKKLMIEGYFVHIIANTPGDIHALKDEFTLQDAKYQFHQSDLRDFDENLFESLAEDMEVQLVMITAGFGRVAEFEYLHSSEIHNLMNVNATACIKIIHCFYGRLKGKETFYCGVMGSIAGFISSPAFSVYAASKAAICRFVESVNIELELSGTSNRILNVSPGVIKGTAFAGGANDLAITLGLAEEIIQHMKKAEVLWIPDLDTYQGVLDRYREDAHSFGIDSYNYKKEAGRIMNQKKVCVGYLSGTFDLFHVGHLNLLRRAKNECDYLIVGVHGSAAWKGKETFISLEERKAIVAACKYVDKVVDSCEEDSDAWALWHYDKLFVGSDYKGTERFCHYEEYFRDKGVKIVYFPYTETTSSTHIRSAIMSKTPCSELSHQA